MEANERLVGSAVFKTVEGSQDPWRVRFPSASAKLTMQGDDPPAPPESAHLKSGFGPLLTPPGSADVKCRIHHSLRVRTPRLQRASNGSGARTTVSGGEFRSCRTTILGERDESVIGFDSCPDRSHHPVDAETA